MFLIIKIAYKNYPWNSTAHEYLNKEKGLFETRFQFSPKSFQEKISNEISKLEQPGLVIIEAPMGAHDIMMTVQ